LILFTLVILFSYSLLAQEVQVPEFKWGKIPDSDLKMTAFPNDPKVPAMVLAKVGLMYFDLTGQDLRFLVERYRRVKIFTKEGFNQGDVVISYQHKDKYDIISLIKAQIIYPNGKKKVLVAADFVEERVNDTYTNIHFRFPDLQEGCVIEYRYLKASKYYYKLPNWYFQEDIPVAWSVLNLKIPEYFQYSMNQIGQKPEIQEDYEPTESFDPFKAKLVSISNYMLASRNMPALKPQSFITTMDDYLSHVTFQLTGTMNNKGEMITYWPTWKKLGGLMNEHESFGKRYKTPAKFGVAFDSIVGKVNAVATPLEKIRVVYDFVQKNITWDGKNDIWVYRDLNEAFRLKKGSSAEINLLVIALLKSFGLPAYPMLISTRNNGEPEETFPIVEQFNDVVGLIILEGKDYYLDAANTYRSMGLLSKNALNKRGWVVHPTEPFWKNIVPDTAITNLALNVKLADNGSVKGSLSAQYQGYAGVDVRQELLNSAAFLPDSQSPEDVVAKVSYVLYDSIKVTNGKDIYKPLLYQTQVTLPAWAESKDSLLFVNPVIQPVFEDNPLSETFRLYPVNLNYPLKHHYEFQFFIPAGYKLAHLPDLLNIDLPKKGGKYDYTATQKGNTIWVTIDTQINQTTFSVDDYQSIKNFFFLLTEKQTEYIVFKKK
jgi:hypothetical protein